MSLNIRRDQCALDFLALGALVHRLDPALSLFAKPVISTFTSVVASTMLLRICRTALD